jgi:hypothetical protein
VVLGEMGWSGMDWLNLTQDRALVNTVMNFQVHKMLGSSLVAASRRAKLYGVYLDK